MQSLAGLWNENTCREKCTTETILLFFFFVCNCNWLQIHIVLCVCARDPIIMKKKNTVDYVNSCVHNLFCVYIINDVLHHHRHSNGSFENIHPIAFGPFNWFIYLKNGRRSLHPKIIRLNRMEKIEKNKANNWIEACVDMVWYTQFLPRENW